MPTARDIMTPETQCASENDTVETAGQQMAHLEVGSPAICGSDDRLKGSITDRDIVAKIIAES